VNIFFDVQGTLISRGDPRPHVREVFLKLVEAGHDLYLWSSGGEAYAAAAAGVLGVRDLLCGCCSKGAPPVRVDFAVDDTPGIRGHLGCCTVPPYRGNPDDTALWRVLDEIPAPR
jgi:hypothetical protein